MTLKRNNLDDTNAPNIPGPFDYQKEQDAIQEALKTQATDSALQELIEQDNAIELEDLNETIAAFSDPDDQRIKETGQTTGLQEPHREAGLSPAVEHIKAPARQAVRPATMDDLENLDESMIMNMPEIKAVSFELIDMLNPKFKDKTIRGRWANCKNNVAGNLGKYLSIGFSYATPDDIDTTRYKLDPSMIEGNTIKYYDVVLLKINVLRLMQLYKTNIVRSINKMGNAAVRGKNEAKRQFSADLASIPGASNRYSEAKQALGGAEPIEFYTPGVDESRVL